MVPIKPNGKAPMVKWEQYQEESATAPEVYEWWQKYPDANVGFVTGKVSNLTVVDIDTSKDGKRLGKHDDLPATRAVRTGSGGLHFYYKYYPGIKNDSRVRDLCDIRNDGGVIVMPPSIHKSGEVYRFINKLPVAPFPSALFGMQMPTGMDQPVFEGQRDKMAVSILGRLFRMSPDTKHDDIWERIKAWNDALVRPPLSEEQLRKCFNSALRMHLQNDPIVKESVIRELNIEAAMDRMDAQRNYREPEKVLSYGYDWLDEKLTGIMPGNLIVIGGESGTGKTTFATKIALNASTQVKVSAYVLEDRIEDYMEKWLWTEVNRQKKKSGVNQVGYPWNDYILKKIEDPAFPELEEKARKVILKYKQVSFARFDELPTVDSVLEKMREDAVNGTELFLLDHLHYLSLFEKNRSKADLIEETMVKIKTFLNNHGVAMLMVVHYKKLDGAKPRLDSFKDSVAIPQNASTIINLYRDRDKEKANPYETDFIVPKSRNPNGEFRIKTVYDPVEDTYHKNLTPEEAEDALDKLA